MSIRQQRLTILESRKGIRPCWWCALSLSCYQATTQEFPQVHSNRHYHGEDPSGGAQAYQAQGKRQEHSLVSHIWSSYGNRVPSQLLPREQVKYSESVIDGSIRAALRPSRWEDGARYHSEDSLSCPLKQARGWYIRNSKHGFPYKRDINGLSRRREYATEAISHTIVPGTSINNKSDDQIMSTFRGENIRKHLEQWQQQQGVNSRLSEYPASHPTPHPEVSQNLSTQSGEDDSFNVVSSEVELEVDDDDRVDLDAEEPAPDPHKNGLFLRKGDLAELFTGIEPILAVFIRNIADQCQFYTMRGEWLHRESTAARFSVPNFMKSSELDDLMPYLPSAAIAEEMVDRLHPLDVNAPREAGAKALEKMTAFHQAADTIFRKYADRLNRTYEIVAPPTAVEERCFMTLAQIAKSVLQKGNVDKLTPAMMWAVHRAIIQSQNITFDKVNFRQSMTYEIYPKQNLDDILKVREWTRGLQEDIVEDAINVSEMSPDEREATRSKNPINAFISKARDVIDRSRRTRQLSPEGCLGPSSVKVETSDINLHTYQAIVLERFTDDEQVIIRYFDAWVTSRYLNDFTNFAAVGPMILRAIGKYDGFDLDASIGFTFLQELGVITPWENRAVYTLKTLWRTGYEDQLSLPTARTSDETGVTKQTSARPMDAMRGLRKDWGAMPVFCIDGPGTLDRDDGISLEHVEGKESEFWVHIHIANPTAFIQPKSVQANYAAHLSEAVYFPERKYPLLPPDLTTQYLSLDDGRPCLTFSARMTIDGEMIEKQITPGIVNNVLFLTPLTVGKELGIENIELFESSTILRAGGKIPVSPERQQRHTEKPLTESHINALRTLMELGAAARHKRTQRGAPEFYSSANLASLHPRVLLEQPVPPTPKVRYQGVRLFEGDPSISIQRRAESYSQVSKMVSDMMVLGGEICATWCTDRNIPIPYRGILRNPEPASSPDVFKEQVIDASIARDGHASQWELMRYMKLLGQAGHSASPIEHYALGLPAYCKATSPLRRYVDMYTHWQIEAALRYEAETGSSLTSRTDDLYLPFSRDAVEEYASTAYHLERRLRNAQSASIRHWMIQALFRAFHFNEAPLPETFEVTCLMRYKRLPQGWLNGWDTRVILPIMNAATIEAGGVQAGDVWEAKISSINPYYKRISMEPIRLIKRGARIESVGRL